MFAVTLDWCNLVQSELHLPRFAFISDHDKLAHSVLTEITTTFHNVNHERSCKGRYHGEPREIQKEGKLQAKKVTLGTQSHPGTFDKGGDIGTDLCLWRYDINCCCLFFLQDLTLVDDDWAEIMSYMMANDATDQSMAPCNVRLPGPRTAFKKTTLNKAIYIRSLQK